MMHASIQDPSLSDVLPTSEPSAKSLPVLTQMPYWDSYYTVAQTTLICVSWDCREPLPPPGHTLVITFPDSQTVAQIQKASLKSTYGEPLYHLTLLRLHTTPPSTQP